jgi:hypothetical protein
MTSADETMAFLAPAVPDWQMHIWNGQDHAGTWGLGHCQEKANGSTQHGHGDGESIKRRALEKVAASNSMVDST